MKKQIDIEKFAIKEIILVPKGTAWHAAILYAAEDKDGKAQYAKRTQMELSASSVAALLTSLNNAVDAVELTP